LALDQVWHTGGAAAQLEVAAWVVGDPDPGPVEDGDVLVGEMDAVGGQEADFQVAQVVEIARW
jgi:hypothetical protein